MKQIIKNIFTIIIIISIVYIIENYNTITKNIERQKRIDENVENYLEIYYLDVGEADSILIRSKEKNILIDAGNNKDGKNLVEFLKEKEIDEFEYVIATHSHEDHIGGMDNILKNFKVNHFFIPDVELEIKTYTEVIDLLNKKKMEKETPRIDQTFQVNDLFFTVLWIGNDKENLNENSIVLKLNYKNTSYLFTSDAPSEVEEQILEKDLKSDVLKVGHHGSRYSTSKEFLEKVDPKYAIISVEENNDYHFPHQTTINKLNAIGATIFRTDLDHTIYLKSDGENIEINSIVTNINVKD